jgi:cytochrome c2
MMGDVLRAAGLAFALALVMATRPSDAGGDAGRGQRFYEECIACHSLERGVHGIGPSLHGVFNRRAGELSDYRYSPALKRSGIVWTADTLLHCRFTAVPPRQPHALCGHAERRRPRRSDRLPAAGSEIAPH